MPMVMIYVFTEPRHYKGKAGESIIFNYGEPQELEIRLLQEIARETVYHVTAYNTYGALVSEIFKSEKTRGKVK